ncbi:5'-3'-deoxyribonucleotidase [Ravibacter arvi]|uniref:5'-3'-deoxyribonucleotidase n=1 Tax=Ravibacter arvi TaxID=2051041 RepID=A0ABP8M1Z4_9BACT
MLRIALDMDDVLADTHGKLVQIILEDFETSLTEKELNNASLKSLLHPRQYRKITEILNAPGFFRDIPVMDDAVDVVRELSKYYEIFVASAAMEFRNSLIDKFDWLDEHFPFIHWKNRVLCGDKSIIKADYLIDDHAFNLIAFSGKGILFNAAGNLDEKGFDRVMNWQEVAEKFLGNAKRTF